REFLHVDDLADACLYLMQHYEDESLINVGWGKDLTIHELADIIQHVVGYEGNLIFDTSKPDGTPRKLMDTAKLTSLGWKPGIALEDGIRQTYQWYCEQKG
ncbi:MAG: NAD-dependent epimerase/dehydratase family protein, partial [Steroidobacter sp.]